MTPAVPRRPSQSSPFGAHSAVALIGDRTPDVAWEALKMARAEAQRRPVFLVDLLGEQSAIEQMAGHGEFEGISDAVRYGVSLARVARPAPDFKSLFVISGGIESPLSDDVLTTHLWGSWRELCHRAGALLVVAARSGVPSLGATLDQMDGLVLVGDVTAPGSMAPLLGRVGLPRRRPAAQHASRRISAEELAVVRRASGRLPRNAALGAAALAATALLVSVWWSSRSGSINLPFGIGRAAPAPIALVDRDAAAGADAPPAEWAVELASLNSVQGAFARASQLSDSLPAATVSAARPGETAAIWYSVLAGAFERAEAADSLLSALRATGRLAADGGRVVRAPLAWMLESSVAVDSLSNRLAALRRLGLPVYALQDGATSGGIFLGAFESDSQGRLIGPFLDSMNVHATLAPRIGRIR